MRKQKKKINTREVTDLVSFIIISDTPAHRMKSYGPAPLLTIKKRKLIDYQISAIYDSFSNPEIIVCVGFESGKVIEYIKTSYPDINIRIVENQFFETTNSCESLRLCLNNTSNDKIFILNGSLLFKPSTVRLCDVSSHCVYIEKNPEKEFEVGVNIGENNNAVHFSYGACKHWSEMIYINDRDSIDYLRLVTSSDSFKNKFIFEAINELIKRDTHFSVIKNRYSMHKVSNLRKYQKLR